MNLKLFKPLNEQIQVIKIKRQGIADSEREELIESIINGDAVESLTEDVELASINEGLSDAVMKYYLKKNNKLAGKSSRKKYDTEIGKYYEDEEKNSASAHANKVRGLRDRVKSDIGNMDQSYRNREISAKKYKKGIKRLNKDAAKDLYHLNKENYNSNVEAANLKRKSNVEAANLKRKQAKEDEKVEKFYKKHSTSFDDLNKAFNDAAGNKPEENKPVETEKAVNFHKTGGLEEVGQKDVVKTETPVENKVVETAKPVENKPVENNRDEEFEKRVNDEVSKRYQAKLDDDAKKKQERQAEINAKRKATYEANKAKKVAEEQAAKEPVKETPSKDAVVETPKKEEPAKEAPVAEAPKKEEEK